MKSLLTPLAALVLLVATGAQAQDKAEYSGTYTLIPMSAKESVIEALNGASTENTIVAVNAPNKAAPQQWVVTSKEGGYYTIRAAHTKDLVITVLNAKTANMNPIVLDVDQGKDSQLWKMEKNEDGSVVLITKLDDKKVLNNPGGRNTPGNPLTIWDYFRHPNVWWKLQPVEAK